MQAPQYLRQHNGQGSPAASAKNLAHFLSIALDEIHQLNCLLAIPSAHDPPTLLRHAAAHIAVPIPGLSRKWVGLESNILCKSGDCDGIGWGMPVQRTSGR
jgi:hypothetical protein